MYLKQAVVANNGPLRWVDVELAFGGAGDPKPLVLVGTNGGGKTNFLSLVTDALFEAASVHYRNILPIKGDARPWFRVVGPRTTTVGQSGGFTLFRFEHQGQTFVYKEKAGIVDPMIAKKRVPAHFADAVGWPTEGAVKTFPIGDDVARDLFEQGAYAYFPASRSEIPYWLNREEMPETEFDIFVHYAKVSRKPIIVERSIDKLKQWLISVILESRADIARQIGWEGTPHLQVIGDPEASLQSASVLNECNLILRRVLDDEHVRFCWLGRSSPDKIAVARGNELFLPSLDALSGGQSILLGLFGTLVRYGDQATGANPLNLKNIEGICIVDEIDTHIHVDLQYRTLPALIKLFPRIQFIVSSHSPFFVLGMEKEFGADGFQLVQMPDGLSVASETYSEFGAAMQAMTATEAFNQNLLSKINRQGIPIVFVEGETDTPYIRRAAYLLGRERLLERCDIQWIGAKDEHGQGFHTGKKALDHTLAMFRANPRLSNRSILLLYDNDAKKADADYGVVSVRGMPTNHENKKVGAGVENLLASTSITDQDYSTSEECKQNGDLVTVKTLRKAELCERMCNHGTEKDFAAFGQALDTIEAFLDRVADYQNP